MGPDRPLTDRLLASNSAEYRWDVAGPTAIHAQVAGPIVRRLHAAGADAVLDLGCGNGWFTAALARCGFSMVGLDQSGSGIEIARSCHPEVRFEQHDLACRLDPAWTRRFDAVVAVEVIEHLLLPRQLIETALGALVPGGLLIVTTPFHGYLKNLALALAGRMDAHWHPLRDHGHVKFFSRATLGALFDEYAFGRVEFERIGRVAPFARSMLMAGEAPR
jgi:2-polyprenyl-6-hydroxyphenyl methylase/3-demethylubiquinone-9 3-methyltransferase